MMTWLGENTNLKWCGYYLEPAPNRSLSGWKGQYTALAGSWGLAPIYVGQQEASTGNGATALTGAQGAADATDAADLAAADQIPARSYIYLDWESGDIAAAGAVDYIRAWMSGVVADARYMPGIYCSHGIAARIVSDIVDQLDPAPEIRFWCWKVPTTSEHAFTGDMANVPELDPAGCGFAGATIWQRDNNADLPLPAGAPKSKLIVDLDTSTLADPGAPA